MMSKLEEGKTLLSSQEFEKALVLFNDFLTEYSNHADALFFRGICQRKLGNFEQSIKDLSLVIEKLPEEATLYSERGVSYYHQKNYQAALDDLNKAVDLEPHKPYRYSSRAYIRAYIDVDGAIADYEKAIELDPEDEIAHNNLGLLLENMGNMREAQKNFKRSNEIIGYNPEGREKGEVGRQKADPDSYRDGGQGTEDRSQKTEDGAQGTEDQSIGKVMLDVFRNKDTRKEFLQFLKSGLHKK